ncbi:hypothetical protein SDC9_202622 [bioreactor metagenome]|uniref:Uncharacterized protein n=1 Tax=bioreactor metagenome TaxID=1076179 RepID=A0A645J648_9ZZZZ
MIAQGTYDQIQHRDCAGRVLRHGMKYPGRTVVFLVVVNRAQFQSILDDENAVVIVVILFDVFV